MVLAQKPPEKQVGAEKKTDVTFFFAMHTIHNVELFKKYVGNNPPNIVVIEYRPDYRLNQMLDGKITIAEYMEGKRYPFPKVTEEEFKFFKELHEKGVRIETLSSEDRGIEAQKGIRMQLLIARDSLSHCLEEGDFEGAVDECVTSGELRGLLNAERDMFKAKEIVGRIRSGDWSSNILVRTGVAHTWPKHQLVEELKGMKDVSVSSLYPFRDMVKDTFGWKNLAGVYPPYNEMDRAVTYHILRNTKLMDEGRKQLLGSRDVIYELICNPELDSEEETKEYYEVIKMINQLSKEECKNLFNEMHSKKMDEETAFKFVKDYLKNRKR